MRRSCLCLVTALLAAGPATDRPGHAQRLDLDPRPGPTAPALGLETHAGHCIAILREEMTALAERSDTADARERRAVLASINVRGIAVKLLEQGDAAEADGSTLALAGYRLFRGREAIDAVLGEITEDAALDAVDRFNDTAPLLPMDLPPDNAEPLDRGLALAVAPLAEAVETQSGGRTADHWIRLDPEMHGDGADRLAVLAERLEAAEVDPDTLQELQRIEAYLRRGAAFSEFRDRVAVYAALLLDVLDLVEAVDAADWIGEEDRTQVRSRIREAATLFGEGQTRAIGQARLERLTAVRRVVAQVTEFSSPPPVGARLVRAQPSERISLDALRAELRQMLTSETASEGAAPRAVALEGVLDRMIAYWQSPEPDVSRELRRAWRKLDDAYRRTEQALVARAPELLAGGSALSDPDLASLIADQGQYLEDLRRVEMIPAWVETARQLDPRAAAPFSARARRAIAWLADPIRRPQAVGDLDRLEAQLILVNEVPYESAIRGGEPAAIVATGGLHAELAAAIDNERKAWAVSWGRGDASAGTRLEMLARLTRTMADAADLLDLGDRGVVLNRWAAWELDPETMQRIVSRLTNRLKVAAAAAIEGDAEELERRLDRIEPAPITLVGLLAARAGAQLDQLPDGALSIVGQSIHGPPSDAWMLASRRDLADLCRYTMELEHARMTDRRELAQSLAAYVNELAGALNEAAGP